MTQRSGERDSEDAVTKFVHWVDSPCDHASLSGSPCDIAAEDEQGQVICEWLVSREGPYGREDRRLELFQGTSGVLDDELSEPFHSKHFTCG